MSHSAEPKPGMEPVINDAADRELGRIIVRYGALVAVLLVVLPLSMAAVNLPSSRLYPAHKLLDWASALLLLLPFFIGTSRLFAARLRIGRALAAEQNWPQAIAALDPFGSPSQRFLDSTGEAHFHLWRAYQAVGNEAKAAETLAFLLKHRRGPWADAAKASPVKQGRTSAKSKRKFAETKRK